MPASQIGDLSESQTKPARRIDDVFFRVASAAVFLVYLYTSLFFQNDVLDDQWITFHYARNLARGFGFRWNPGERPVEGFTCFLWVVINAVGIRLRVSPLFWSQCCSFVAGSAMIALILSSQNILIKSRFWRIVSALMLATCPVAAFMAQSGMETQLSVSLVIFAVLAWAFAEIRNSIWGYLLASAMLVLACMTRPENGIFLLMLPLCTWWNWRPKAGSARGANLRHTGLIALCVPALIASVPYMIWRIVYFGYLFPNTYYAKYAGHGLGNLIFGVTYTGTVLSEYLAVPLVIVLFSLLFAPDRNQRLISELLIIGVIFIGYITYAGGDDTAAFPYGRLLLPIICLMYILAAASMENLFARSSRRVALGAGLFLVILLLAQGAPITFLLGKAANPQLKHTVSVHQAMFGSVILQKLEHPGRMRPSPLSQWVAAHTETTDYIALGGAGRVPYFADRPTIDMGGLNDVHIAHLRPLGRGIVAKGDLSYVIGRRPRLILVLVARDCTGDYLKRECASGDSEWQVLRILQEGSDYHLDPAWFYWDDNPQGGVIRCFVRNN